MSSSDSSPAPTSSNSPQPSPSGPPQQQPVNSSSLYLFTFLATLFILLFISCSIVARSFVLRRRYRQRLEEALAQGIVLAPELDANGTPSRRKVFKTKPKLVDVWLDVPMEKRNFQTWHDLMPVSAQPVKSKSKRRSSSKSSPPETESAQTFFNRVFRPPQSRSPSRTPSETELKPVPSVTKEKQSKLQLSVIIAMPSSLPSWPSPKLHDDEEEREVPDIALGTCRIRPSVSATTTAEDEEEEDVVEGPSLIRRETED